jgi:cardiolipin synthase
MIPIFCYFYLSATSQKEYTIAAIILIVAALTDKLDGTIAHRFNMITDFGKIIDPLADKLLQVIAMICLTVTYPRIWVLAIALIAKELYMCVKGFKILGEITQVDGAQWFGKLSTVIVFSSLVGLTYFPNLSQLQINFVIVVNLVFLCFSFGMYFYKYRKYLL